MRVAVIPARGGSKRIPRKNIKEFCGKPMIAWSIETALESGCFDRVVVSTDDAEIAEIARQRGADVPFTRPEHLSDDYAGTLPVMAHAVEWLQQEDVELEPVCCIYATAPFLQSSDLQSGLERMRQFGCDYAFSVTEFHFPIQRAIRLNKDGRVAMFSPGHFHTRSQDLEPAYHDAGQFYWGRPVAWLEQRPIFTRDACPVVLPACRVQDIDTEDDWRRAEWMFRAWKADENREHRHPTGVLNRTRKLLGGGVRYGLHQS